VASHATVARYYCSAAAHRYCLHSCSTFQKKKSGSAHKPAGQHACGADHKNQPAFCMQGGPARFATPT